MSQNNSYAEKNSSYYQQVRPEMFDFIPGTAKKVLDVGCSSGNFAMEVKRRNGAEVWGVEPFESAAAEAREKLDKVYASTFSEQLHLPEQYFDCIIFNDVLEHMPYPQEALAYAKRLLQTNGVIVASIPNIRYYKALKTIVNKADFPWEESFIFDKTHLRFFTKKSIERMFIQAGFTIQKLEGINKQVSTASGFWISLLNVLSGNKFADIRYLQFAVVASV